MSYDIISGMKKNVKEKALRTLAEKFANLNWSSYQIAVKGSVETVQRWLGDEDEEVMVCVFSGREYREKFHRQDYYFMNFAYRGDYDAVSQRTGNTITIREGECYVSQPFAGYAIRADGRSERTIIGVLVKKETFHKTFLPFLVCDERLLGFFLGARDNRFADECIHLKVAAGSPMWDILELMAVEYSGRSDDSQAILKPLAVSLLMCFAREFRRERRRNADADAPLEEKIVRYMSERMDAVSLADIAAHFGYHPNYLSSLLHKRLGRTFGQVLASLRMDRAKMLIENSALSLEDISSMLGYSEPSAFYKAYKTYFNSTPRNGSH